MSEVKQRSTQRFQLVPTVGIFCRELKEKGDPFSNEGYWQAYQDLLLGLKARGVQAYFLTDNNSYRGFGKFEKAYTLDEKTTIDNLKITRDVHVDLVFDRGGFIGRDVLTINPPIITRIAASKIEMYEYFTDLQPHSFVTHSKKQVLKAANRLPGDKIVVKEPEGSGGKEVYIGKKKEVIEELPQRFPVLVQEFLDTSKGVPGQVDGPHDVRILFCGSDIIGYYIRTPDEGKLHANVSQGGKQAYLDPKEAPAELIKIAQTVDSLFAEQPRYYAVDFMNTEKGWKLVEINSYPGLGAISNGPRAQKTLDKLANYLVAECKKWVV